ncbi:AMP-binding protein [Nocardia sp. CC227C]|uniref:AMP-binding protein n=1 Tax=Nocardia sp. CC227C TaxID=3044562 RepID=UPI00278BD112|nr:AMP-binding protein [Nocardia sp. CC227C]
MESVVPELLSAVERYRLVDEWANGVELSGYPAVPALIERGRRVPAIRPALRCGAATLTYGELFERMARGTAAGRCEASLDGAVRLLADIAAAANSGAALTLSMPTGPNETASTIGLRADALAAAVDDRRAVTTDCRAGHIDPAQGTTNIRLLATAWTCADTAVELLAAIADGATLVVATEAQRHDPAALADLVADTGATHVVAEAAVLARFADTAAVPLPTVRRWDVTGTRCPAILPDLLRELAPGSVAGFAYTAPEYAGVVARGPLDGSGRVRPIPGARVLVLDAYLRPVAPGRSGRIYLGGTALAAEIDADAAPFVADPFVAGARLCRTGISGRWTADGWLTFATGDIVTEHEATGSDLGVNATIFPEIAA